MKFLSKNKGLVIFTVFFLIGISAWVRYQNRHISVIPESNPSEPTFAHKDKRLEQYGESVPMMPEINNRGKGSLSEAQVKSFVKYHTGIDLPETVKDISGSYIHCESSRDSMLYGGQTVNFTLPPEEAKAAYNGLSAYWKSKYPRKESGDGFSAAPLQYPFSFEKGEPEILGVEMCIVYPYIGLHDRVYCWFDPGTGRMRLSRGWGEQ